MSLLRKTALLSVFGSATFSIAASIPRTIQPDNIVLCEPNAGCVNQTLFGRSYKVLTTPRFTVMISVATEGAYTRADVSITNHTDTPLSLCPDDFRVEVLTPKPKVLLYVPPADLKDLPPNPPAASSAQIPAHAPGPTNAAMPANATTPPSEVDVLYAAAQQKAAIQESADKAAAEKPLLATSLAPSEVTRGRVYFERDKKAHLVNVVLPIAGVVFEFPYAMKK